MLVFSRINEISFVAKLKINLASLVKFNIDYFHGYGLLMKTSDGIIMINKVYYKKQYYSDNELLRLKNLLF